MRISAPALAAAIALAVTGCSSLEPLPVLPGCNPLLGGSDCFLPYPSDFFRDPATGLIETEGPAKLLGKDGLSADVSEWRPLRGFSRIPSIATSFAVPISRANLPGIFDDPESTTWAVRLIEAPTGRSIPCFVDLDPLAASDAERAMIIHPQVSLQPSTRYIVAVSGLTSPSGQAIAAPEGFRRLRDRETSADPEALGALATRYETEIFPPLAAIGLERSALQLAWDFTTGEDEDVTRDMIRARELAIAEVARTPPQVEIIAVEEDEDPAARVWRIIRGKITAPLVLESPLPGEGSPLARDGSGAVRLNGTLQAAFVILVPGTVRDQTGPGRAIAYGHGFFGTAREIEMNFPIEMANRLRAVVFAIDWWGMSREDSLTVADAVVGQPAHTLSFTDGVHQAMVNWIAMSEAIPGALTEVEGLKRPGSGELLYDPATAHNFIGLSQGHILGGVAAAIVPRFSRVVLNVGGAGFTHIMFRARPFLPFVELFEYSVGDPLKLQKITVTMQRHFDRIDPAIYARYVSDAPLPQSPADRRVLLQIGVADTQVPNVASWLHGRVLGAGLTSAPVRPVWGFAPYADQVAGLTIYDFGIDPAFNLEARPPDQPNEVHEGVRMLDAALSQMDRLFRPDGAIADFCDGPCDPE